MWRRAAVNAAEQRGRRGYADRFFEQCPCSRSGKFKIALGVASRFWASAIRDTNERFDIKQHWLTIRRLGQVDRQRAEGHGDLESLSASRDPLADHRQRLSSAESAILIVRSDQYGIKTHQRADWQSGWFEIRGIPAPDDDMRRGWCGSMCRAFACGWRGIASIPRMRAMSCRTCSPASCDVYQSSMPIANGSRTVPG